MVTEQVDEELTARLERRLAILEAKMPQTAESDALEGHVHRPIMPRVATVGDLPATRQKPTLYAVATTPNTAPRVFVVYAGGQIELDASDGPVPAHQHAHSDLTSVLNSGGAVDHHTKYTDEEARLAVPSRTYQSFGGTG